MEGFTEKQHAKKIEQTLASIDKNLERITKSLKKMEPVPFMKLTAEEGNTSKTGPEEAENDDHVRFGDVVGFKTLAGDVTTGIVIDIRNGNAAILYQNIYDDRLSLSYKLLEDLRRLKITYSEITEDVMNWLTT